MDNQLIILTGAKNNSGDFLIKDRVINLLKKERPDRELILFNSWEPITEEKLAIINKSNALILAGGPSLRENIYPDIYPLTENLDSIKVPIIVLGIGWKSKIGQINEAVNINFTKKSKELLKKLANNGTKNSVRDYSSLVLLKNNGIDNVVMTGCPALNQDEKTFANLQTLEIDKITFSLGVSFVNNPMIFNEMKLEILEMSKFFKNKQFKVAFHHSLENNEFIDNHHFQKHKEFRDYLQRNNISYIDISKGVDKMKEVYNETDFHFGYRVHAHILMSSIGKPSILLAEDGRGIALKDVLGGMIYPSFSVNHLEPLDNSTIKNKIINRMLFKSYEKSKQNNGALLPLRNNYKSILVIYENEVSNNFVQTNSVLRNLAIHKETMVKFIKQLP